MESVVKPEKTPDFIRTMQDDAIKIGLTAYRLRKDTGIPLRTAQRFLAGGLNPAASTMEITAAALGLVIDVRKAKR